MRSDIDSLNQDVLIVEKNNAALEKGFRLIKQDFAGVNRDLDEVQSGMEIINNLLQKNNLHMQGLQEHVERKNFKSFNVHLFLDSDNSNSKSALSIESVFRIGSYRRFRKTPKDILIKFPD